MTNYKHCATLANVINLPSDLTKSKIYAIPDQYILRLKESVNCTDIVLSKLERDVCGVTVLVHIWENRFDKIIGFDVSAENTELLIFSNSHIHIYSFFNEIIEDVKQIDLKSLILPIQSHPNAKVITKVLPIHSTLQTAQFIVCFQDQLFYFLVDINQDVLLLSVELPRALCCSWNMEFIYVLTHDGFLCKYSSASGSPVGENFNIHSVIPKFHKHLQFHHLSISHNNRDACLVDSGLVYLFQIDEDQSDIETGLDICLELDAEGSNQIGSSYESASKKKWSFLEKIIKKNRHDEIVDVASTPVQSISSAFTVLDIIPDVEDTEIFVEFVTEGVVVWTRNSSGGEYRIFSCEKGELLTRHFFRDSSCLLQDPTLNTQNPSYHIVATEQSLVIPFASDRLCDHFKQDIKESHSSTSRWGPLLQLFSLVDTTMLPSNNSILQIVLLSFQHSQLDILDYCLEFHMNLFKIEYYESNADMRSVTSSVESSAVFNMLGLESMEFLDKILQVILQNGSTADLKFYGHCLERTIFHLVHLVKLCNGRESHQLSFEILKKVPPLTTDLHLKCNRPVDSHAWNSLRPTQVLYLNIHSPSFSIQDVSTVERQEVLDLIEECIENRDFGQVQSVLNKLAYNIDTELKSLFCSTLNPLTREFILDHVENHILNQIEQETYVCYQELHRTYTRLVVQLATPSEEHDNKAKNMHEVTEKKAILVQSYSDEESLEGSILLNTEESMEVSDRGDENANRTSDVNDETVDRKENTTIPKVVNSDKEESNTHVDIKSCVLECVPDVRKLSFGEFLTYSMETKMKITAQMYFQTYDDCLLEYLSKEVCWQYLLESNMLDQIQSWILGTAVWSVSKEWNLSQSMIDQVHTLNTTPDTKEFILNQFCTTFGIFSSDERQDILLIISRLVKCQLLTKLEQVLCYPTSNVSYEYFTAQFILLCIERKQWSLLSCMLETVRFSDLSSETRDLKPVKLWSCLNETFKSSSPSPSQLIHLISSVGDILDEPQDNAVQISKYFIATCGSCDQNFDKKVPDEKNSDDVNCDTNETFSSHDQTIPEFDSTVESIHINDLLASSDLYRSALKSPALIQDINLSTLLENNASFNFSSALSRNYTTLKNKSKLECKLNLSHHLKLRRGITSFYENEIAKTAGDSLGLNSMLEFAVNNAKDSGFVTSALCVLKLVGEDEAHFATLVRGVRSLHEGDIGCIFSKDSSTSLLDSIIKKSISNCSDLKSWCPVINICKQYTSPIPEELFDILIKKSKWMELLIACDVFNYADAEKLIHLFKSPTIRQHLRYALVHTLTPTDPAHFDLLEVIESCHSNVENLCQAALAHCSPCLAILAEAVSLTNESASNKHIQHHCLRLYLLACMQISEEKNLDLIEIMGMAVRKKCLALLHDALQMLMPDEPLTEYVSALCDFVMFDRKLTLEKMTASISAMTPNQNWIVRAVVCLTHEALSLMSSVSQLDLLKTLSEAQFRKIESTKDDLATVSLENTLRKAQCLQRTNIYLDFTHLWPQVNQKYEDSILNSLLDRKLFAKAQSFCSLSRLPTVQITMAQWSEIISQEKYLTDVDFWKMIDSDFKANEINDEDGFEFFIHAAQSITSPVDKYKCYKLGLERSSDPNADIQRQMHRLCLDCDFDLTRLNECWKFNPVVPTENKFENESGVVEHSEKTEKLTDIQHSRLDHLIASMLEKGDLNSAVLVSHLFHWEHVDCLVLEQMAKAATQQESGEDVLTQLCAKLRRGKPLGLFFVAAYRLLCSLDLSMADIISTDGNLILSRITDVNLPMQCVQDLVCVVSMELSQSDVALVISSVIYSSLHDGLQEEAVSNRLLLWGYDLNSEFARFVSLCDSTELGLCLYYKAKNFLTTTESIPVDIARLTVELLISCHECFTSACNMEGVVSVLNQCRRLVVHLLGLSAWSLMVRLLTGIGRYVEMNYVYQLLKENQQFEFLLRKGYDKNPSFKLATLDFVRSDKSLFQLVALNFCLYAELAAMFQLDAQSLVAKLALTSDGRLVCSESNRTLLHDVIDNYTHAAQHFIQAQKLKQATNLVNQAELMSLQLDLLNSALTTTSEDCLSLSAIPAKDLTPVIAHDLTYQQAAVVLNAYDSPVDWSMVLHNQVIVKGNRSYLTLWLTNHRLSSNVVQDIVTRYQKDSKLTADMIANMKYLISHVKPLELKYRLGSQLNFKDIVHSILINPDVAWLKDTVWQVGYKQKGGLK